MKSNTIIIIVVTLLLVGGAYWYFAGQSDTQAPLTASMGFDNPAQTQFQELVSQLLPISFNTGIFSDPRFTSLVDLATPIVPESIGRVDPFAPIPGAPGK